MKKSYGQFLFLVIAILAMKTFSQGQVTVYVANCAALDQTNAKWKVSVLMSSIAEADIVSIALIDGATGKTIDYGQRIFVSSSAPNEVEGFRFPLVELDKTHPYILVISVNKRKADGSFDKVVSTSHDLTLVSLSAPATQTGSPHPSSIPLQLKKSKAKKDSDFYFAGEAVGARGKKTAYSTDIKVEPRFGPGAWNYIPFFHLMASTKPDADPDTMDIGFKMTRDYILHKKDSGDHGHLVNDLVLSLGGKIESERDFDNTNLLFEPNLTFLFQPIPVGKKSTIILAPVIGFEGGKNLKSPLTVAEGSGVLRGFAGIDLLFDIPLDRRFVQEITFESSYARRWLLRSELGFKANDDDELVLVKYGRGPRDHVSSKMSFSINDFFSPYIEYEWGELPPSYKLINHSFKIGFAYKFSLTTKNH